VVIAKSNNCSKYSSRIKNNRILGTPNEENWAGVSQLKDYKNSFPQWQKQEFKINPGFNLDSLGISLLEKMFTYDPTKRITAD